MRARSFIICLVCVCVEAHVCEDVRAEGGAGARMQRAAAQHEITAIQFVYLRRLYLRRLYRAPPEETSAPAASPTATQYDVLKGLQVDAYSKGARSLVRRMVPKHHRVRVPPGRF